MEFETAVIEHIRNVVEKTSDVRQKYATAFVTAVAVVENYVRLAMTEDKPREEIVCTAGCDACCKGLMGENLTLTEAEFVCITEVVGKKRFEFNGGCPLLEDGKCSVYLYRPIVCRAMNSFDANWCKKPPLIYSIGPEGNAPVYYPQYHITMAVSRALSAALNQKQFRLVDKLKETKWQT